MLRRFLPKEEGFFKLFQKTADMLVDSTQQFHTMLLHLQQTQAYVDKIAHNEAEGDRVTTQTFELLHKTFITPFDHHDIHHLTSALDDILDLINRCAQRFPIYQLTSVPETLIQLAHISHDAANHLQRSIYSLHHLNKSAEIFAFCEQLNQCESEAHQVVLQGEKLLFSENLDYKHFFKLKEIYAQTKLVINRCQDAGNMIKGMILEYT